MPMHVDTVSRVIAVIIAPTVLITSCSLLINGLLQRFENMSTRLRGMNLERLRLLREDDHHLTEARLRQINVQAPRMLRRLGLLRNALLMAYLAIFISVVSMFIIAAAVLTTAAVAALFALLLLLAGMAALLISVAITTTEVWRAHLDVIFEMDDSARLGRDPLLPGR
jgi:predicted membrane-bound spermidine synthase